MSDFDFEFEDPPPRKPTAPKSGGYVRALRAHLESNPGRWTKVPRVYKHGNAGSTLRKVLGGKRFEATCRGQDDGTFLVWARFNPPKGEAS